jgi:hypothetical protein
VISEGRDDRLHPADSARIGAVMVYNYPVAHV